MVSSAFGTSRRYGDGGGCPCRCLSPSAWLWGVGRRVQALWDHRMPNPFIGFAAVVLCTPCWNRWELQNQANVANFDDNKSKVNAMSFSENGYYVASGAEDGSIKVRCRWCVLSPRWWWWCGGCISFTWLVDPVLVVTGLGPPNSEGRPGLHARQQGGIVSRFRQLWRVPRCRQRGHRRVRVVVPCLGTRVAGCRNVCAGLYVWMGGLTVCLWCVCRCRGVCAVCTTRPIGAAS